MTDPEHIDVGNMKNVSWRIRRRFMVCVSLFCGLVISYVLYMNMESRVAETAVTMAFSTITLIIMAYTGVATWEDIRKMNTKGE